MKLVQPSGKSLKINFLHMLLFVAIGLLYQSDKAIAQSCSLASLSGNYSVRVNGTNYQDPDFPNQAIAYASVETAHFDGAGKFSGAFTTNVINHGVSKLNFTGTYKVKSDCTATFTVGTFTFFVVIADGGNEYYSVLRNKGKHS